MKTPSETVAKNAFLCSLSLFLLVLTVKVTLFTPEFVVHMNYVYPDIGYGFENTTTLVTPDPTSPVDYSRSSEVPPGYDVVPQPQPFVPLPKK